MAVIFILSAGLPLAVSPRPALIVFETPEFILADNYGIYLQICAHQKESTIGTLSTKAPKFEKRHLNSRFILWSKINQFDPP
jgi:hypothetical protein